MVLNLGSFSDSIVRTVAFSNIYLGYKLFLWEINLIYLFLRNKYLKFPTIFDINLKEFFSRNGKRSFWLPIVIPQKGGLARNLD